MSMVISLTSGKGGAGKSSIAVGIATAFATKNKKTILVEMDFGLRGLDVFLGVSQEITYHIEDVLAKRCEIKQSIIKVEGFPCLHYIPSSSSLPSGVEFHLIEQLIETLKQEYEMVVIDTSAGFGLSVLICMKLSDLTVIATTPDPVCMRGGAKVTALLEKNGFTNYRMVINRVRAKLLKHADVSDLDTVIDEVGAALLGVMPEDELYRKYSANGIFPTEHPQMARIFDAIVRRIDGELVPLVVAKMRR